MKDKIDFDDFAHDYRMIHNQNIGNISGTDSEYFGRYKVKEVRRKERAESQDVILDLGCGDGLNAKFFQEYFPTANYIGIDVSKESIAVAKKWENKRVRFGVYDGKHIPAKDDSIDIIFVSCVFHHVDPTEHISLLQECQRVLKVDGRIYIFEHNPYNPLTQKVVKDCVFDKDAILISAHRLRKKMIKAGFNALKTSYTIFMPRKGIFNKLLKYEKFLWWLPIGGQYYIMAKNFY